MTINQFDWFAAETYEGTGLLTTDVITLLSSAYVNILVTFYKFSDYWAKRDVFFTAHNYICDIKVKGLDAIHVKKLSRYVSRTFIPYLYIIFYIYNFNTGQI